MTPSTPARRAAARSASASAARKARVDPSPRCAGSRAARVEREVERIGPVRSSCATRTQRTAALARGVLMGRPSRREAAAVP